MRRVLSFAAALIALSGAADVLGEFHFVGQLGYDGRVPVELTFAVNGENVVVGEITYTRAANRPITLVGFTDEQMSHFRLCEYLPDGTISGRLEFNLDLSDNGGEDYPSLKDGVWTNPRTGRQLDINVEDDVYLGDFSRFYDYATEDQVPGVYSYNAFPGAKGKKKGGNAVFESRGDHTLRFTITNNERTLAVANSLITRPVKLTPNTYNSFYYPDMNVAGYGLEAYFYKKFVVIRSLIPPSGKCGFGGNGHLEGVYFKQKK